MIRYETFLALAVLLAATPALTSAKYVPQSAFGIVASTPIAELYVRAIDGEHNAHTLSAVPVPLDGPWTYGVAPSPSAGVCDDFAFTSALPAAQAGALKASSISICPAA